MRLCDIQHSVLYTYVQTYLPTLVSTPVCLRFHSSNDCDQHASESDQYNFIDLETAKGIQADDRKWDRVSAFIGHGKAFICRSGVAMLLCMLSDCYTLVFNG